MCIRDRPITINSIELNPSVDDSEFEFPETSETPETPETPQTVKEENNN